MTPGEAIRTANRAGVILTLTPESGLRCDPPPPPALRAALVANKPEIVALLKAPRTALTIEFEHAGHLWPFVLVSDDYQGDRFEELPVLTRSQARTAQEAGNLCDVVVALKRKVKIADGTPLDEVTAFVRSEMTKLADLPPRDTP